MVKVFKNMKMVINMMENGKIIRGMEWDCLYTRMEISIKETG